MSKSFIWIPIKRYKCCSGPNGMTWYEHMKHKPSYHVYIDQFNTSSCWYSASKVKSLNFVIWWHDGQSKRPLRQDKHGHYFLISHLLFVLQYFYHNFESCCWTIYTNRKIILHDVFVQLQSIFNSTNINHGQFYPIFGFWLKYQPFLVYKRLNNEDITYLLLHSTILTYIATTRTL